MFWCITWKKTNTIPPPEPNLNETFNDSATFSSGLPKVAESCRNRSLHSARETAPGGHFWRSPTEVWPGLQEPWPSSSGGSGPGLRMRSCDVGRSCVHAPPTFPPWGPFEFATQAVFAQPKGLLFNHRKSFRFDRSGFWNRNRFDSTEVISV